MDFKDERTSYWAELSRYDLETAQAMQDSERWLYVGFMCHQAVEKMLKAYYVNRKNQNAPHTHNLAVLANKSGILNDLSKSQQDFLDIIGPLNIEARYPSDKTQLLNTMTKEKCSSIIQKTKELITWIENKLSKLQKNTQK